MSNVIKREKKNIWGKCNKEEEVFSSSHETSFLPFPLELISREKMREQIFKGFIGGAL
jgi:hypothetical protein